MPHNIQALAGAARASNPLVALSDSKQVSSDARDWLTAALDPFHDYEIQDLRGFPDISTEPTVVVKMQQSIDVGAPPGVTGNWDAHIITSPIDYSAVNAQVAEGGKFGYNLACVSEPRGGAARGAGYVSAYMQSNQGTTYVLPLARMDGLLINTVASGLPNGGSDTFTPTHCMEYNAAVISHSQMQQINMDAFMDFNPTDLAIYRVVYSGFEVVNTTASLNSQGACTVYEYGHNYAPMCTQDASVPGQAQQYGHSMANYFRSPPNNLAMAKVMPGAETWEARKGCYNVAKFQDMNPFTAVGRNEWVWQQNSSMRGQDSGYLTPSFDNIGNFSAGSICSNGLGLDQGIEDAPFAFPEGVTAGHHFSRMTTTGAYFTGLSNSTTLTITWRVGIERLPAANNPQMLALSSPSAPYDPDALALYALICTRLPPGCPQNYNDMGKWFRMISSVARDVIPTAFPLVGTAQMILEARGLPGASKALGAAAAFAQTPQGQAMLAKVKEKAKQMATSARTPRSTPNFGAKR